MLRKTIDEEGKDWDKLIPYLLFAYQEVPQASTGFSPFELIYGRNVRGPLDVLKESWEAGGQCKTVVEHVLLMREKLSQMTELMKQNLREAQRKQKTWYDSHSRSREFRDGDLVLVLLPSSSNKLLAQWQGPYQVLRRCGKVTYTVCVKKKLTQRNFLRS